MKIYFNDLSKKAQNRIIKDELQMTQNERFVICRLKIDKERPNHPEQCIHAYVFKEGEKDCGIQLYLLMWDVRYNEITRTMREKERPMSRTISRKQVESVRKAYVDAIKKELKSV